MDKDIGQLSHDLAKLHIEQSTLSKIRMQIEYYFCMANLVTDTNMRKMITSNHRGWVKMKQLATFNRLRMLLYQQFQFKLNSLQMEKVFAKSLEHSDILKAAFGRIKLKKHVVWDRQFERVLYFEGNNLRENDLYEILSTQNVKKEHVKIRIGNNWFFVDFYQMTSQEVNNVYIHLKEQIKLETSINVLSIKEFFKYKEQYQQIIGQRVNDKVEEDQMQFVKIEPRKMMDFSDFTQKKNKTVVKNVKGITKKSVFHMPKNYLKTRNKKSLEQYKQYQTKKIAQKRQTKANKRTTCQQPMQIEYKN